MIRWLALAVIVVVISAVAAWVSMSLPEEDSSAGVLEYPGATGEAGGRSGPKPTLVLSEPLKFDFGVMPQQSKDLHEWSIRNDGPGVLKITGTQPSCSCTVVDPKPGQEIIVQPGTTYTVKVEWETRQMMGKYEKSARVLTNDPRHPQLDFIVSGIAQPAIMMIPSDGLIMARDVSNDQPHEFTAVLSSQDRPDMTITSLSSSNPELLDVSHRPLNAEECKSANLKTGHRVSVVVKPSSKLGSFQDEVIIQTDHPLRSEVRLSVSGRVVGPISITPTSGLRLPDVSGPKGRDSFVILWVRGQESTEFELSSVPENLKVTVMPDDDKPKGTAGGRSYKVNVNIPPGTAPGVIDQPIILKTDHPLAKEVRIPVFIQVLGEG